MGIVPLSGSAVFCAFAMSHAHTRRKKADVNLFTGGFLTDWMHTANAVTTRNAKHFEYVGMANGKLYDDAANAASSSELAHEMGASRK